MTGIYYTPSHVFEPCQIYDTCSNVGEFLELINPTRALLHE